MTVEVMGRDAGWIAIAGGAHIILTELISNREFGKMVCLRDESVMGVDIAEAVGHLNLVDPNGEVVATARAMGICFGD